MNLTNNSHQASILLAQKLTVKKIMKEYSALVKYYRSKAAQSFWLKRNVSDKCLKNWFGGQHLAFKHCAIVSYLAEKEDAT